MGSSSSKSAQRSLENIPITLAQQVTTAKIDVLPSSFILINENRFEQMYKLGAVLGEGSSGQVRKCVHRDTRQVRAVKIFNRQILSLEEETITQELNIMKTIDHPNIVRVFEYFVDHRYVFLVMEYCRGGQLQGRITTQLQFTEREVALIMRQLFSAVAYMQNIGITHKEITPENLLLEEKSGDLNIKLIDFGGSAGKTKRVEDYRSVHYIAPEIIAAANADGCDLWSVGVIMFVLLSGKFPFEGDSDSVIVQRIVQGTFSMTGGLWNSVSSEAKDLIRSILVPASERITAIDALNHIWFTRFNFDLHVDQEFVRTVLANVLRFQFSTKIQLAALTFITTQLLSSQDTKDLREVFRMIDKTGDGRISKAELIEVYRETMPPSEAEKAVSQIMARADTDGSGFMDYTEFLRASIDLKALLTEKLLAEVFAVFDRDGNGTISSAEIMKVFRGNSLVDENVWSQIIEEVDANGDGVIDIREFKEILLAKV